MQLRKMTPRTNHAIHVWGKTHRRNRKIIQNNTPCKKSCSSGDEIASFVDQFVTSRDGWN